MRPYIRIFVVSVVITALLFWYDFRHDATGGVSSRQMVFDIAVWGSIYALAIFAVASVMYFLASKIVPLIKKSTPGKK